ncbi:MAG: hypothetical protein VYB80_02105 [Actinomycetota bacterium]|nr:hypothetical protein [Actinomycetota bacterium]
MVMRITRQFTLLKALVLVAFVAIVCSSCIKADFSIVVDADGTGSISGEMAVSKKLGEVFGEESGDPEEFDCESAFEGDELSDWAAPAGASVENFEDDEWCGFRFSANFTGFGQSLLEAGDDDFPLSIDGNILTFYWEEGLGDEGEFSELGDGDMDPKLFLTLLGIPEPEYLISIDLPGEILEHNADEQKGSTLKWNIDIFESLDGPAVAPFAKADISKSSGGSGGGGPAILWIIIGIVAVVLALLAIKLSQSRKENETEDAI